MNPLALAGLIAAGAALWLVVASGVAVLFGRMAALADAGLDEHDDDEDGWA